MRLESSFTTFFRNVRFTILFGSSFCKYGTVKQSDTHRESVFKCFFFTGTYDLHQKGFNEDLILMIRSLEFFCKGINGAVDDGIRPVYMWIIRPYAEQGVYHLLFEHSVSPFCPSSR